MATKQNQSFAEHLIASATGNFNWPTDAILYHLPQERELLSDRVRRLVWQAYLQIAKLPFTNEIAPNADYMSPTGRAPFLCLNLGTHPIIFSDFDKLVSFLEAQHLSLGSDLESQERADMEAYLSLINTKILPAVEYQTWVNPKNVREHTISTHGYSLSWPLNTIVPRLQQARFIWNNWDTYRRSQREVLLEFEQACSAVSSRLGNKETFFDSGLTTLDAVVCGYLQAIMSMVLPSSELAKVVTQFKNLRDFCSRTLPENDLVETQLADKSLLSDSVYKMADESIQHES